MNRNGMTMHRVAFGVAMFVFVAGAATFHVAQDAMDVVLFKEAAPLRRPLRELPTVVGAWKRVGTDETLSAEIIEELGTEEYLSRTYAVDGDPSNGRLTLHIAYYTGIIDAVPHIPERCFVGNGLETEQSFTALDIGVDQSRWWVASAEELAPEGDPEYMTVSRSGEIVRLPDLDDGAVRMNAAEYWFPDRPEHHLAAGYFFIANDALTPRAANVRALAFRPSERYAYYCKVQLTYVHPTKSVTRDDLAEVAAGFLDQMLPEIMRCLPDWAEIEEAESMRRAEG
ncbi:MAG: exosortase-associated EpsI family protein [Phycisphaerales bacterium]